MIECSACRATNADRVSACAKCGAPLDGLKGGTKADDATEEAVKRERDSDDRVRRLRRTHAGVGAMTFFLLQLLVGLPDSLMPGALLTGAIGSTIVGLPIGYLISRFRAGGIGGALISAAAFMVLGLVLGAGSRTLMWGLIGILPGALIGIHVTMDE